MRRTAASCACANNFGEPWRQHPRQVVGPGPGGSTEQEQEPRTLQRKQREFVQQLVVLGALLAEVPLSERTALCRALCRAACRAACRGRSILGLCAAASKHRPRRSHRPPAGWPAPAAPPRPRATPAFYLGSAQPRPPPVLRGGLRKALTRSGTVTTWTSGPGKKERA